MSILLKVLAFTLPGTIVHRPVATYFLAESLIEPFSIPDIQIDSRQTAALSVGTFGLRARVRPPFRRE